MGNNKKPFLIFELANSKKAKRPSGFREAFMSDPLDNKESLIAFIKQLDISYINSKKIDSLEINLEKIKLIRNAIEKILTNLVAKKKFSSEIKILNEFSKNCFWTRQLNGDGTNSEYLKSDTLTGIIASICIMELAISDINRIKICSNPLCGFFFYDTTRNLSARWHAENPCGWRMRSNRRK